MIFFQQTISMTLELQKEMMRIMSTSTKSGVRRVAIFFGNQHTKFMQAVKSREKKSEAGL